MSQVDIALLDSCITQVAMSTDDTLEATVQRILCPVLRKLSQTSDAAVKRKAMETIATIQGLVKPKQQLRLPLEDLLDTWRTEEGARNFTALFVSMALERMTASTLAAQLPQVLRGVSRVSSAHRNALLRSVLGALPEIAPETGAWADFLRDDADRQCVLAWFLKLLLLPRSLTEAENNELTLDGKKPLAWPADSLAKTKESILRLLDSTQLFPSNDEVYQHLVVGTGEASSAAQDRAQTSLMRRRLDRESAALMDKMLLLAERTNPPVSFGIRDAVIAQLCKSAIVCQPPQLARTLKIALGTLFQESDNVNANQRLKNRGVQLLRWVLKNVQGEHLTPFATAIVGGLLQLVSKTPASTTTESLREGCYACIGAVVASCGAPFRSSLAIPNAFASQMQREQPVSSVFQALRTALLEMAPAFASSLAVPTEQLEAFLDTLVKSPSAEVRSIACRWSKETLPFNHARGRAIALCLADDEHISVSAEARQALNPYGENHAYPAFGDMLAAVLERTPKGDAESGLSAVAPPLWHEQAIRFLWRCLDGRAPDAAQLPVWDQFLWKAIEHGRVTSGLPGVAAQHLVMTLRLDSCKILQQTSDLWIRSRLEFVVHNAYAGPARPDSRVTFSTLAGLVHAVLSPEHDQVRSAVSASVEKAVAMLTAKSLPVERQACALRLIGLLASVHATDALSTKVWDVILRELAESREAVIISSALSGAAELCRRGIFTTASVEERIITACMDLMAGPIVKSERAVAESAIQLMGCIFLGLELVDQSGARKLAFAERVIDALFKVAPSSSHGEIPWVSGETLAIVLQGHGSDCAFAADWKWFDQPRVGGQDGKAFGCPSLVRSTLRRIFRDPMSSGNLKQRECCAVWLLSVVRFSANVILPDLLHVQQALSILLSDPSSLTREVASRGLLYCWDLGKEDDRTNLLDGIVKDFGGANAGKQKIDREVFPDDALRTPKASSAASTSSSSSSSSASSSSRTAPEGSAKEGFKQLASVAKGVDTNLAPSLFSLAGDPSVWLSGSRAAAFDSDNNRLIQRAQQQLLPHLPKMFPTLWRGQYWPEVYVAQSCRRVLRTLVAAAVEEQQQKKQEATAAPSPNNSINNSNATADASGDGQNIPDEGPGSRPSQRKRVRGAHLGLSEMLTRQIVPVCELIETGVRDRDASTREASLACIGDLISGRAWEEFPEGFFGVLWKIVLVGLDDMKESVREAASGACSALAQLTTRLVDVSHTPNPEVAFGVAVTQILEFGLQSASKEVQVKAVLVLKGVLKAAGRVSRGHVADALEKLLHSASALESEMISYLSQHAGKEEADQLHAARAALSRMTPLGECIDECLRWIDNDNVLAVCSAIESGLNGAGLPTLLQSTWAVSSLTRASAALDVIRGKPATSVTLACLKALERHRNNPPSFKEICSAIGGIASFASQKLWSLKIIPMINDFYFLSGDDVTSRFLSGHLTASLARDNRSVEVLRGRLKDIIPTVWIGRSDSEKNVRTEFSEVFVSLGAPSSMSLYNEEIVSVIVSNVTTNRSWAVRRQCYRALSLLASHLVSARETLFKTLDVVLSETQLSKQAWKGKGSMLRSLAALLSIALTQNADEDLCVRVVGALRDEVAKTGRTVKYLTTAAKALLSVVREAGTLISSEKRRVLWNTLWPVPLDTVLREQLGEKSRMTFHETLFLVVAYGVVPQSFAAAAEEDAYFAKLYEVLETGVCRQKHWEIRVAALTAVQKVLVAGPRDLSVSSLKFLLSIIVFSLNDKFPAVRESAARLVLSEEFRTLNIAQQKEDWIKAISDIKLSTETERAVEALKAKFM